jgi:hypothetical protein
MDDAVLVRDFERPRDLPRVSKRVVQRHPSLPKPLVERLAIDELEHESTDPFRFNEAVNRRDVRMIQCGERLGFLTQPRHPIGVRRHAL